MRKFSIACTIYKARLFSTYTVEHDTFKVQPAIRDISLSFRGSPLLDDEEILTRSNIRVDMPSYGVRTSHRPRGESGRSSFPGLQANNLLSDWTCQKTGRISMDLLDLQDTQGDDKGRLTAAGDSFARELHARGSEWLSTEFSTESSKQRALAGDEPLYDEPHVAGRAHVILLGLL